MAPELKAVVQFVQIAQQVIALRILTYLGFIASSSLFGVALWQPSWERAVTASLFAVLVYWPSLRIESKSSASSGE